ncbi:DUF4376 domain-containing protein [Comamonas jiangduensis]|uniref:DUF4376 domain-containing protein n=1 Tax=Comamonas jiangduensis TaxID=1194168 RepID=UPI0028AD6394|nr:DUF4376 domain-containing protein [Comamonas jiangduensis]
MNKFFFKDGAPTAFSPLQIAEGLAAGLQELTEAEKQAHLNPVRVLTVESVKDAITQKRWEVETGGLTLPNGVQIATGIDDQNRITSVIANARLAGLDSVSFKAASGWVTLTLTELEGVAAAIAMHVQQCFSAERAHHEAIDSLEAAHADNQEALQQALQAYDLEQGLPATDLREPQPA